MIIYSERSVAINIPIDPDMKMFCTTTTTVILFAVSRDESAKEENVLSILVLKAYFFIAVVRVRLS